MKNLLQWILPIICLGVSYSTWGASREADGRKTGYVRAGSSISSPYTRALNMDPPSRPLLKVYVKSYYEEILASGGVAYALPSFRDSLATILEQEEPGRFSTSFFQQQAAHNLLREALTEKAHPIPLELRKYATASLGAPLVRACFPELLDPEMLVEIDMREKKGKVIAMFKAK